jgi:hypothetical protein
MCGVYFPKQLCFPTIRLLQYNFDHTFTDVQIFLDGNTNFDELLPEEALEPGVAYSSVAG